jgi:probable HAF family extracellular repeat protein
MRTTAPLCDGAGGSRHLGGDWARVFSISGDGAVAVGMSALAGTIPGDYHAFRWSSAGMVDLNPMPKRMSSEQQASAAMGRLLSGPAK